MRLSIAPKHGVARIAHVTHRFTKRLDVALNYLNNKIPNQEFYTNDIL